MKKILAIIASILAAAACSVPESTFSAQNIGDYCTCKEGALSNDYGNKLNVTSDNTDGKWNVEGNRMYAVFDILNANLDITLKSYITGTVKSNSGALQKDDIPTGDPITISDCNISGGYLNVLFTYYFKDGTDTSHETSLYYNDEDGVLNLFLVHEGGGENPAEMEESSLKSKNVLYCFRFLDIVPSGEYRTIVLDADLLGIGSDKEYVCKHTSSYLYGQPVQF